MEHTAIAAGSRDSMHEPPVTPYTFDGPYEHCYEIPQVCMDKRHVYLLHDILKAHPFTSALEIGSFMGATATAFVEAVNSGVGLGESGAVVFCDVSVQASLIDVVGNIKDPERAKITPQPSWAVLDSQIPWDFIFVDGAHDIDTVTLEVKRLLKRRPLCVMAHDTNGPDAGVSVCEGAKYLADVFKAQPDYFWLEDARKREGEATDRGLFFATTSEELYRKAKEIYARWNTWTTDSQKCIAATT
jgi:hypothetical protein